MAITKPKTQKDTIDQIWFMLIGTNGKGFIEVSREYFKKVDMLIDIDIKLQNNSFEHNKRKADHFRVWRIAGIIFGITWPVWLYIFGFIKLI